MKNLFYMFPCYYFSLVLLGLLGLLDLLGGTIRFRKRPDPYIQKQLCVASDNPLVYSSYEVGWVYKDMWDYLI